VPFRDFGWIAGQNEQDAIANRLDNLITLCPACHQRAEQGVAVQSSLSSLGRVLRQLIPLFLMCDPHDTQVASELLAPQTGLPTLFITESAPGGIGLIGELLAVFPELLAHAAEHIRNCPCLAGCPSCIGPVDAPEAKSQVSALLDVLISV